MAAANVDVVHRLATLFSAGDVDGTLSHFDDDCVVSFPPVVPEPGPFRGRAELRKWAEGFLGAYETLEVEVLEAEDRGDRVFALVRLSGRGAESAIDTEVVFAYLYEFRGERIVRWEGFVDPEQARAAARNGG